MELWLHACMYHASQPVLFGGSRVKKVENHWSRDRGFSMLVSVLEQMLWSYASEVWVIYLADVFGLGILWLSRFFSPSICRIVGDRVWSPCIPSAAPGWGSGALAQQHHCSLLVEILRWSEDDADSFFCAVIHVNLRVPFESGFSDYESKA